MEEGRCDSVHRELHLALSRMAHGFGAGGDDQHELDPGGARRRLRRAVDRFVEREKSWHESIAAPGCDNPPLNAYWGQGWRQAENLNVDRAAVPSPGEAGTANLVQLVSNEDKLLLLNKTILRLERPQDHELRRYPVLCSVEKGAYPALLHRMIAAGMVKVLPGGAGVIENGIFGVPKEPTSNCAQRLVWDGRRSNLFFRPEFAEVRLPAPDLLAELVLPPGKDLYVSTSDVSQMYNRLRVPEWLWPFFGLPKIWGPKFYPGTASRYLWPVLVVMPMGWNLAVRFAQSVYVEMLRRLGISPNRLVIRNSMNPLLSASKGRSFSVRTSTISVCLAALWA